MITFGLYISARMCRHFPRYTLIRKTFDGSKDQQYVAEIATSKARTDRELLASQQVTHERE